MIKLGGPDRSSIAQAAGWPNGLFISPLIDNNNPDIHAFLIERYFTNGAALFGRESVDEMNDFREVCGGRLDNASHEVVVAIVQYYVQRLRNYSRIGFFVQAEIKNARVDVGCPEHDDDRIVNVDDAAATLQRLREMSFDDYYRLAYDRDVGFPPFWMLCRCGMSGMIAGLDY